MMKNKKGVGAVEIIFMLFIMIIIFIAFYSFLYRLFEAGPEYAALRDLEETIETVCADGGPEELTINMYLPADNGAQAREDLLWIEGIKFFYIKASTKKLVLYQEEIPPDATCARGWLNIGEEPCPTVKSIELKCAAEIEGACIWPCGLGYESIDVKVEKEIIDGKTKIKLINAKSGDKFPSKCTDQQNQICAT